MANESYGSFVAGLHRPLAAESGDAEAGKLRVTYPREKSVVVCKSLAQVPPDFIARGDKIR